MLWVLRMLMKLMVVVMMVLAMVPRDGSGCHGDGGHNDDSYST